MTLGKQLIQNEIKRFKRGVSEAKKAIDSIGVKGNKSGYKKTIELHEESIRELTTDLNKL